MKKLVSIFLALALLLAVSIPAFAANLNITDLGDRDYVGYKLLNLTTSPKAEGEGYNYAYTVNAKYRTILRNEVFAANNAIAATAADVTDTQIIEYLAAQQGDSNGVYNSMRTVADRIYRAIKAANPAITPDAQT